MGNAESNPVRNMDKRTSRRENSAVFSKAISKYRSENLENREVSSSGSFNDVSFNEGELTVVVRKRPIFPHEISSSEFDVVTCIGKKNLCIHDARCSPFLTEHFYTN